MTSRKRTTSVSRGVLAALVSSTCGLIALTAMPSAAAPTVRAQDYTFAFQNADITLVVQEVFGQLGVPYAIDPAITGKVSFRIEQRLTREQLLASLEAVLAANGVTIIQNGSQYMVSPEAKAKTTAKIRRDVAGAGGAGYEIVAVPLAYAQPSEVAHAMEAISAANTVLYSNDKLGLLLIAGSGQQLKSALDTLKVFDQDAFQDSKLRWFELSQATASTVSDELDRIAKGAGLVGVAVVPLKRLNGVIVFGRSKESLDELGKWVRRLDVADKAAGSSLWVYRPKNTSAESLAQTLSSVLGIQNQFGLADSTASPSPPTSTQNAPIVAQPRLVQDANSNADEAFRIGVDKDTNALLFTATPQKWIQISKILNEIDKAPRQVFIEASVLEVTLTNDFKYGVDWTYAADGLSVGSVNNGSGSVGLSFPGLSVSYVGTDIKAAMKALGSKTTFEVISAPKIIALDNKTARLQVGDQVPIVVQSSQSTQGPQPQIVSTVDYRNTGVILSVKPRITGEDNVLMEVSQEISSATQTSSSGINSPTIQQRRFESTLVVHNGGVVALGGLISSNRSSSSSGIPGLQEIPVMGSLFKTQGKGTVRSEMIVLLSAKILADTASAERALGELALDMRELQSRGMFPPKQ